MIKTNDEIVKLKFAATLGDKCFEHICGYIRPGMTEVQIAEEMDRFMIENGASGTAFETIVGSGVNSSQIHSTPTKKEIQDGDIILLDFGCVLDGYCSDTSRTIFVGSVSDEYKKVYEIVKESQEKAINEIKARMSCKEADNTAREYIKQAGYDFAHALGHGVGKEVHEEPTIAPRFEDVYLENNMVFSIEPGIYIENKFGVRIEDTAVLKDGKVEVLSKANKELIIIKN